MEMETSILSPEPVNKSEIWTTSFMINGRYGLIFPIQIGRWKATENYDVSTVEEALVLWNFRKDDKKLYVIFNARWYSTHMGRCEESRRRMFLG